MEQAKYGHSQAQHFSNLFCTANQALAADKIAIHELGFGLDSERLEMFEHVAQDQKAQLRSALFDALLDRGLEAADIALAKAASLNPWNVNTAINMLEERHFKTQVVVAALRRIAKQKGKPAMLAAYRDLIAIIKNARAGWQTGSAMASDPANADLQLAVAALEVLQGNAELGLAISATEVAESLVYLGYASGEVDALTKASDDKLMHLTALSDRLKKHVADMASARTAWRNTTNFATATPVCKQ